MIKNIILQQKTEKENFFLKKYIHREKLNYAKKFLKNNLIKIITGPRRAGKSTFAMLLLQDENFAYLNFDDELLKTINTDEIIKGLFEIYKNPKYILFDEIQNLKDWELFVNKLQRRDYNITITGSNANLLSTELASALTGRHIPIEILPFNFREFLKAKEFDTSEDIVELPEVKGKILNYLSEYLETGGFPEIVVNKLDVKAYLTTLFDSILLKDIIKRHNVKLSQNIYNLSYYLLSNCSCEYSFNKLKNILNARSVVTLQNYFQYLKEAYLVYSLNRFSFKVKEQIKAPSKLYLVDNGLIASKITSHSLNLGKAIENLTFVELLNRGKRPNLDLFYYKTRNQKEVDFVLRKEIKINQLIQVSYDLSNPYTEKREINSLLEASEELKCSNLSIITWDLEKKITISKRKLNFIPLWKWLLEV